MEVLGVANNRRSCNLINFCFVQRLIVKCEVMYFTLF